MLREKKRLLVGLVTVCAVLVFVATLVTSSLWIPDAQSGPPAAVVTALPTAPKELPQRLIIPTLGIDATVQYVGVRKNGEMGIPNNFTDVAWYQYGIVPGQQGSAVIDGHVDNALSLPGVFKHLDTIKPGDDIYVQTASSTRLRFVVTETQSYPYAEVPLERLFNTKNGAYLNLITCGGTWIQSAKSYDKRLVVYARFDGVESPR